MSAAPSFINPRIDEVRKSLKCIDGDFGKLAGEHKELVKYYSQYKALAKKINLKMDGCEKTENPVSKKQ